MIDLWVFAVPFAVSLGVSLLFVSRPTFLMSKEHMLRDLTARQAQHTCPTPRVGGLGIIFGFLVGCLFLIDHLQRDLALAFAPGIVVFCVGLREDIHRDVSPRARLLAAFISAACAIILTGTLVPDLGLVPGSLLNWILPAIVITLLWSAGTCHALNLIDGLNGLSSFYTIAASVGLLVIAGYTGDTDIQIAAGLLIMSVLGFLLLNWPGGRIFLGDAGAYGIGHILAWLGISLVARNPSVAGMAVLLLLFWPVCDTLFAIFRRRVARRATGQPDRLHFHHLVVRMLPLILRRGRRKSLDNPTAAVLLMPLLSVPILTGILLWDQPVKAAFALAFFISLFCITYMVTMHHLRTLRFRRQRSLGQALPGFQRTGRLISPLSGEYAQGNEVLDVQITKDSVTAPWRLQVAAVRNGTTLYAREFETDDEAYNHFAKAG